LFNRRFLAIIAKAANGRAEREGDMGTVRTVLLGAVYASVLAITAATGTAMAGGLCSEIVVICDNGRSYPLCPIAVSDEGEVVTGYLRTAGRRGAHVRLVPMGVGYRYAGYGIWLDGDGPDADLHFGKYKSFSCTVARP
jgi:hypothetical protein